MIFRLLLVTLLLLVLQSPKTLSIYAIDVEGGKATLVVAPGGESLLIDAGNIGEGAPRDAERIIAAIRDAGVQKIDHLLITHWHRDHIGATAILARRFPIQEFIDHGPNTQPDPPVDEFLKAYPRLYAGSKHTVVQPGDRILMSGVDIVVVASAGETIADSLPNAGAPNPYCVGFVPEAPDKTENAQSIGLRIQFGKFRVVDLGDLSAEREFNLMCPANRVGAADLFMVSHHGQPNSDTEVLVHAIQARAAIMNNGIRKGGQSEVMKVIHSAPGLQDLWQLHFSLLSGQEYTVPGLFIANGADVPQKAMPIDPMPTPPRGEPLPPHAIHNGAAHWIKVSAQETGDFTVTNSRNGFSKNYRN